MLIRPRAISYRRKIERKMTLNLAFNRAFSQLNLRNVVLLSRLPILTPAVSISSDSHAHTSSSASGRTQPRVYLLNQHKKSSIQFDESMMALRAYSLFQRPETVEVVLKCKMMYKKVLSCKMSCFVHVIVALHLLNFLG